MEEGEYYAIETFGSTGRGRVIEEVFFSLATFHGMNINIFLTGRVFALCKSV